MAFIFLICNSTIIFGMQNSAIGKNDPSIKASLPSLKFLASKACVPLPHDRLPGELREYIHIVSIKDNRSCLFEACKKGNSSIIQDLICLGVNIDEKHDDNPRETPLTMSAQYGHTSCVELLLRNGARDRYTAALAAAVRHNKPQCIEVLSRNPEPLYSVGTYYYCGKDNPEALRTLLEYLPSAATPATLKHAALCYLRGSTNPTCLALILDKGVNINATYAVEWVSERTLLMEAIRLHKMEMIALLLKRKADVNLRDSGGYTAFMHLIDDRCYYNYRMDEFRQIIALLVQYDAQVLDQDLDKALKSCTSDVKDGWGKAIREIIQASKTVV